MLRIFHQCQRGADNFEYPDGGATLDQPLLLVDAFTLIRAQKARLARERG